MAWAADLQTIRMNEAGVFVAAVFGTVLPRAAAENRVNAVFNSERKNIRAVRPVDEITDFEGGAEFFLKASGNRYNLLLWNIFKRLSGCEETDSKS